MDNLIGKTLDGLYNIQELIGAGGMANVYKAVVGPGGPVPEGTVVAVKVLRQELMHDPDLVRRFKNESKAISLLNHPNIVKVYDVSVSDHLQYIVMEYVDGMTLREYLNERGGKLTSRETVHFISQILKALDHAHRNGVVHRDIKPQNIMLLDNGQLRMMDFGIARISRAENQLLSGKTMGSVHYISPEQAKGDETDCTSDIYSVGVMMYEMLSGHLPFDADDMVEVAIKQISDQPKSLHGLPVGQPAAALVKVLAQCHAVHIFHHDILQIIIHRYIVHFYDVWVVQQRDGLGFIFKAAHKVRVVHILLPQHLYRHHGTGRHRAVVPQHDRLVDVCHAAGTDQLPHLIQAVQLFADQVVHQRTSSTHSSSAVMLSGPPFSLAVRIRRSGRS